MASFFDLAELDRTPPQQGFPEEAVRAWAGHVAAGRLGPLTPSPGAAGEYRLASLARIMGRRA